VTNTLQQILLINVLLNKR